MLRTFAIAASGVVLSASLAAAATLDLVPDAPFGAPNTIPAAGSGPTNFGVLDAFNGVGFTPVDLNHPLFAGQIVPGTTPVTTFDSTNAGGGNGLFVNGPAIVTITYLGREAAFDNFAPTTTFTVGAGALSSKQSKFGDTVTYTFDPGVSPALLDFSFQTGRAPNAIVAANGGPITAPLLLSYTNVFNSGRSVIALFEDKNGADLDIDDMLVRIDVAPIPLPAAAWTLIAGVSGLLVVGRRRRAAATA